MCSFFQLRIFCTRYLPLPPCISAYHKTNVLLVTLWRSDSTFMTSLFNKHPDVFYIPDLLIMAKPLDNKKTRLFVEFWKIVEFPDFVSIFVAVFLYFSICFYIHYFSHICFYISCFYAIFMFLFASGSLLSQVLLLCETQQGRMWLTIFRLRQ